MSRMGGPVVVVPTTGPPPAPEPEPGPRFQQRTAASTNKTKKCTLRESKDYLLGNVPRRARPAANAHKPPVRATTQAPAASRVAHVAPARFRPRGRIPSLVAMCNARLDRRRALELKYERQLHGGSQQRAQELQEANLVLASEVQRVQDESSCLRRANPGSEPFVARKAGRSSSTSVGDSCALLSAAGHRAPSESPRCGLDDVCT
ncbi:unnamed protein product [Pedinophyceae sp. YPF-701]|nr:unnamed protein product [Pedinophyceae sp. YPF-701]